jgi:hypothetical protein
MQIASSGIQSFTPDMDSRLRGNDEEEGGKMTKDNYLDNRREWPKVI